MLIEAPLLGVVVAFAVLVASEEDVVRDLSSDFEYASPSFSRLFSRPLR